MATAPVRLSEAEIARRPAVLKPGWQREGEAVSREFVLGGFAEAAQFIAKITPITDAMDHHRDGQFYRFQRVKIILTTHSAGGVTQNDSDRAAKIDRLV